MAGGEIQIDHLGVGPALGPMGIVAVGNQHLAAMPGAGQGGGDLWVK